MRGLHLSIYSAYNIMKMLLDPNVDQSGIASRQPVGTTHNATCVVDLSKLDHPDDVKKKTTSASGSIVVHIPKSLSIHSMRWSQ